MRRFDAPYAAVVAHGDLAARATESETLAQDATLSPPFDDPAVVVAVTVALVRLGRGLGPSGLGWGPTRAELRSCHWRQEGVWNLRLVSPTVQGLADAEANDEAGATQAASSAPENSAADLGARAPLPVSLVELLAAHARRGSAACVAVLAWVARCGMLPGDVNIASTGLPLGLKAKHRPRPRALDPALFHRIAAPHAQPDSHAVATSFAAVPMPETCHD